uniref:Uncharacterized protein n=1 Tax=Candidatus Methanogaster sp. ANME-2c ERB4 TaxID=2759911 RepID=A0A7G9YNN3_9EURY|nr:hypothetical protein AIHMFPNM_00018 [Methanosarcinales archaeon ANME-2c ERB4]
MTMAKLKRPIAVWVLLISIIFSAQASACEVTGPNQLEIVLRPYSGVNMTLLNEYCARVKTGPKKLRDKKLVEMFFKFEYQWTYFIREMRHVRLILTPHIFMAFTKHAVAPNSVGRGLAGALLQYSTNRP